MPCPPEPRADATVGITFVDLVRRSLFPLVTLVLILGTTLWGPWVTLGLTVAWWRTVTRCA